MTTLKDIARAAKVSPAVVSRVINKDLTLRISKETRRRVEELLETFDYAPNSAARSLRRAQSGLIAVVVHDVTNLVYSEIIRGLQSGANAGGKALILSDASNLGDRTSRISEMIGGGGVDGLILQGAGEAPDLMIARAVRNELPIVLLQAHLGIEARLLKLPDEEGAVLATDHLVGLGHRNLACIATAPGLTFTEARIAGWRNVLETAGLADVADRFCYSLPTVTDGLAAARTILDEFPDTTGLVCFNAMIAIGAIKAAEERGLSIPEDLSIIGLHDIKLAEFLKVPLTSVAMPLFEMGQQAVGLLMDTSLPPSMETTVEHPAPRLIIRGSTGTPRSV